jgi:signal transduction histidine kinase
VDRDVTEKKEIEDRLLKSEKFAAIGELATMVAHDLRNPLQSIATSIYYLKKSTEQIGNENINAILQRIEDSVGYSEKIIKDLLDYSATFKLELTETDPKSLFKLSLSEIVVPAKIKIINKTHGKPKVLVDFNRFRRLIVNLVLNAFESMPNGGTMTIISSARNDSLELRIMDTGTGIPKEKMEKLWTPFVTTKAKGMGLGLPICKRIVEAHKGEILVETENGKGTTFVIRIPIMASGNENLAFFVEENPTILAEKNKKIKQI